MTNLTEVIYGDFSLFMLTNWNDKACCGNIVSFIQFGDENRDESILYCSTVIDLLAWGGTRVGKSM